jgi:hypothetical protein
VSQPGGTAFLYDDTNSAAASHVDPCMTHPARSTKRHRRRSPLVTVSAGSPGSTGEDSHRRVRSCCSAKSSRFASIANRQTRRSKHPAQYATAEKRFGIESRPPVVPIVTGRETPSLFEEVTMRGRRSAWTITLDFQSRTTLRGFLQRRKTPGGLARRAHAILLLEQGHSYVRIGQMGGLG